LIAYHSTTGNTEKVAKAIKEGITGYEMDFFEGREFEDNKITEVARNIIYCN